MSVQVIGTLKPKNGLNFPVVEAIDVAVEGYASLADAVTHFATDAAIAALTAAIDAKADKTTTDSLQAQIDQIVISASAESVVAPEVAQARVDADGVEHSTLKSRIDKDSNNLHNIVIDANNVERGSWSRGIKVNEIKRLRTKSAIYVHEGDCIQFNSDHLYYDAIVLANEPSETQQNAIEDSGWISSKYYFKHTGYVVVLYATASTYAASESITVADYDANTCTITDVFEVLDAKKSISDLQGETNALKKITYQNAKNLIPYNTTELAPCFIPAGTAITISTADGSTLGVAGGVDLCLYDKNKNQTNSWHWGETSSKRTVETLSDTYYIALGKAIEKELQVEIGERTAYEPYNINMLGSIFDLYSISKQFENIISKKMSDYPVELGSVDRSGSIASTKRIRTVGYVAISGTCSVKISTGNNVSVAYYDEDKVYLGGTPWLSNAVVDNPSAKFIRIVARKASNNPDIAEEEIEEIANLVVIDRPFSEGAYSDIGNEASLGDDVKSLALNAIRKTRSANFDTFTLLHFSDLHGRANRLQTVLDFYTNNQEKYAIQDALLTGDIVYQKYSNGMEWFDAVEDSENILLAIGNHDATEGPDYEKNDHTQAELWSQYFSSRISNWDVEYDSGNTYYYKDYRSSGIRLIVLNSMLESLDVTAQNTWLETVLNDALTSELAVVIACHYRCNSSIKLSTNFTDYNKVLNNYPRYSLSAETMAIVQNFIDNGGEFVCYLCGHMHTDVISYNETYSGQIFVAVTDAYGWTNYDSDLDRSHSPDAFNLFFVDRSNHCFKLIRIGANCDPYLRERNSITVDYTNKNIISMN